MTIQAISQELLDQARAAKVWGFATFASHFNHLVEQGKVIDGFSATPGDTEYHEGMVNSKTLNLSRNQTIAAVDSLGRPMIITNTIFGNVILFRRHNTGFILTSNHPAALSGFIPSGDLCMQEDMVCHLVGAGCDNIGVSVDRLAAVHNKVSTGASAKRF